MDLTKINELLAAGDLEGAGKLIAEMKAEAEAAAAESARVAVEALRAEVLEQVDLLGSKSVKAILARLGDLNADGFAVVVAGGVTSVRWMRSAEKVTVKPAGAKATKGTGTFVGDRATFEAVVPKSEWDKAEAEIKASTLRSARWHIQSKYIKEYTKKAA